jgi:hypothetical protein
MVTGASAEGVTPIIFHNYEDRAGKALGALAIGDALDKCLPLPGFTSNINPQPDKRTPI